MRDEPFDDSLSDDAGCSWSAELPAYLQDELVPERALDVAEHLECCAACRQERDELRVLLLDLDGFESARPRFESYLASVRGYRTNRYDEAPETAALVEAHWGRFLEHWGYGRRAAVQ